MQVTDAMVAKALKAYDAAVPEDHGASANGMEAALTAALAEMWLDIGDGDDLSRSGQRILVTGGGLEGEVEAAKYNSRIGCWDAETCTLDDREDEADGYSRPTHFMPLPAPPMGRG